MIILCVHENIYFSEHLGILGSAIIKLTNNAFK